MRLSSATCATPFVRAGSSRARRRDLWWPRFVVACGQGGAGHSVGHYPSYYPDEIRIDAVDPAAAGKGLVDETLHAYVGAVAELRRAGAGAREVGEVAWIVSGPFLQ